MRRWLPALGLVTLVACYASHSRPGERDAGAPTDAFALPDARDAGPRRDAASCVEGRACDDGDACTVGDRCRAGVCAGTPRACETPPGPCFARAGRCVDGACAYETDDSAMCDDGDPCMVGDACLEGACGGQPMVCDTPPSDECADDVTLRRFAATGTCAAGSCGYAATERPCADGCVAGACVCVPRPWSTTTVETWPPLLGGVGVDAIAVDVGGTVHVAYLLQADAAPYEQRVAYASRPAGGAWTIEPVGSAARPSAAPPRLQLDGSGNVHVIYRAFVAATAMDAWVDAVRSPSGAWTQHGLTLPPTGGFDERAPLAFEVDGGGRVHVLFMRVDVPGYATWSATGGWETVEERPSMRGWTPRSLRVDDTGAVHALFVTNSGVPGDPARYALRSARRSPSGGTWSTALVATAPGSIDARAAVRGGAVHAVFTSYARTRPRALFHGRRPTAAGGAWTVDAASALDDVEGLGGLAIDDAGGAHVSYQPTGPSTAPRLGYARRDPAGGWVRDPVPFAADFGPLTWQSSVVVEDDGGVHLAYSRAGEPLDHAYRRSCR